MQNLNQTECTGTGGLWADTTHIDLAQINFESEDVTVTDNVSTTTGAQGVFSAGNATPNSDNMYRANIARNTFSTAYSNGITITGTDLRIVDNTIDFNPSAEFQPRISIFRLEGGAVRGGRNTAPIINNPSGVDLAAAVENGDVVVPPDLPRIILPPWRPAIPNRVATPPGAPFYVTGGVIWPSGNPTIGTYLSVQYGGWVNTAGTTFEFRWTRNGGIIAGQTTPLYLVAAPDVVGDVIGVELRATNTYGSSAWTLIGTKTVA